METAELPLTDFKLPPAHSLDSDDRENLMRKAITRIRDGAKELVSHEEVLDAADSSLWRAKPADMWMLLLVRMVTRVSDPFAESEEDMKVDGDEVGVRSEIYDRQERLRHALCEYIMADFSGRYVMAEVHRQRPVLKTHTTQDTTRQHLDERRMV